MWKFLTKLTEQFFGFLKSRNGLILMALVFLYLGVVNLAEIKDLIETMKGLFE